MFLNFILKQCFHEHSYILVYVFFLEQINRNENLRSTGKHMFESFDTCYKNAHQKTQKQFLLLWHCMRDLIPHSQHFIHSPMFITFQEYLSAWQIRIVIYYICVSLIIEMQTIFYIFIAHKYSLPPLWYLFHLTFPCLSCHWSVSTQFNR